MPACRLCTNTDQRYTLPLVLFLGPESGCFDVSPIYFTRKTSPNHYLIQGRIPTYWKVEAIPYNRRLDDHTDFTIGLAYDKDRQLRICTTELEPECHNAASIFFASGLRASRQLAGTRQVQAPGHPTNATLRATPTTNTTLRANAVKQRTAMTSRLRGQSSPQKASKKP